MSKDKSGGRPVARRNPRAGQRLRQALKISGKTWRRDTQSQDHVLNWDNWIACALPRSSTTIDRDIRQGVPEDRIAAYARCFGITPEALASSDTDMHEIMGGGGLAGREGTPSRVLGYKDLFPRRYLEHNPDAYVSELFALMNGVYRMSYLISEVQTIHRCALWIYKAEAYHLAAKGMFIMFGVENTAHGDLFRWHNNLHLHYLCQNGMELGYTLTVDPLRHNLVQRRSPFWLKGRGLTDRGLADNAPVTFVFRKEKQPLPPGMSQEQLWNRECDVIRQKPFIAPGEPGYEDLWSLIMAPDELT